MLDVFAVSFGLNLLLMIIGAVTIVAAVVMAMVQHDFRKLLSFHAVSQVGYMILGIGTGTAIGIAGGLFHMLNNAIYKSCLYLTAGAVEKRTGTSDLAKLGGLARVMPFTFVTFGIAALAISGIPPFNGFVSKWMVYQGLVEAGISQYWIFLVAAMFGSALTVASFVKVAHGVFLGETPRGLSGVTRLVLPCGLLRRCWRPCVLSSESQRRCRWLSSSDRPLVCSSRVFRMPSPSEVCGAPRWGRDCCWWHFCLDTACMRLSRPGKIRVVAAYIGGETAGEGSTDTLSTGYARNRGIADTRVLGTEFYDSVRGLPLLRTLYDKGESGIFDIQRLGALASPVGRALSVLHSGKLSSYVTWIILAVVILIVAVLAT